MDFLFLILLRNFLLKETQQHFHPSHHFPCFLISVFFLLSLKNFVFENLLYSSFYAKTNNSNLLNEWTTKFKENSLVFLLVLLVLLLFLLLFSLLLLLPLLRVHEILLSLQNNTFPNNKEKWTFVHEIIELNKKKRTLQKFI